MTDNLWKAINDYVISCGGNPDEHVYGNIQRQDAVVRVEKFIQDLIKADCVEGCNAAHAHVPFPPDYGSSDPICQDRTTQEWYFYDNVWCGVHGPFMTREEAQEQLKKYAEML